MLRKRVSGASMAILPIVLLLAVASLQMVHARFEHLVAWKGGGFGMFATIDAPDFREVRLFDAAGRECEIPSVASGQERRVRTFPNRDAVLALTQALEHEHPGVEIVRAEVWQTRFTGRPLRAHKSLLVRVDLDTP